MSQFKRFNSSENQNYNNSSAYPEGTLTWDPNNGLRIHDGSTSGGVQVVGTSYSGTTAIHDMVFGGGSSGDNGKFIQQVNTNQVQWAWGVSVWKSGINVVNPEVTTPYLTISYYGQEVRIINTSGGNNSYLYQGRKIASDGTVTQFTQTGIGIDSADFHTITSLNSVGDMVILDVLYDPTYNVVYRVTVMMGWSGGNHGQISIEQIV